MAVMARQTKSRLDREELRTLVADALDLPIEEVTDDASFVTDLDVDSLTAMEVMVRIEKRYGVKLEDDDFAQLRSLGSAYDLLTIKLATV
jgi:acyl carrier protein